MKLAQIMSRFPKLSETFVLNEITTLQSLGVDVEIFPLLREKQPVSHPEVERLARAAHFQPFISLPILRAHAHFIRSNPRAYFGTLGEVLVKTLGSSNFFIGALGIFPKSVRFAYDMERIGVSHVHAHFATHPALAALIVHRLTGIPFSFTAHGSDLHVDRRALDTKVEAAAFAATVSRFNKEVMVEECGEQMRDRIHVIHCGVHPSFFTADRPAGRQGFRIVCVASLEEVKGHRFLVEACRILAERGVEFTCDLAGDGPERRAIQDQIERCKLADRVRILGPRSRDEVVDLLAAADAVVLASHPTRKGKREGIPVALMEAMASGLPVVASRLTGIPELVEDGVTGLLVPSGGPAAMADALHKLSADASLRERMGRAGREKVRREFDLETNTRELLRLVSVAQRERTPAATPSLETALSGAAG